MSAKKFRTALEEEIFGSSDNQTSPLAQCYREGRDLFGEESAGVIAKALRNGKDADEIREAFDNVREYEGDVRDLAYELSERE